MDDPQIPDMYTCEMCNGIMEFPMLTVRQCVFCGSGRVREYKKSDVGFDIVEPDVVVDDE